MVLIWLVMGASTASQRRYYGSSSATCAHGGTIGGASAGPLNYAGVNPKISCHLPSPSS